MSASTSHSSLPSPASLPKSRSIVARALVGLGLTLATAIGAAFLLHASIDPVEEAQTEIAPQTRSDLLADVSSWGYQLQGLDVAQAAQSPFDLLVVDEELDGVKPVERRAQFVKSLKAKPEGTRRLVLSYLSIGEAEDYRGYWDRSWAAPVPSASTGSAIKEVASLATRAHASVGSVKTALPIRRPAEAAPAWLGDENPDWRGNYRVRFWDQDWQAMLLGNETAAIDRIIAAGFDGVYLDRADVHAYWSKERRQARADMIALIERISAYARDKAPGFLIVMQNAEELLDNVHLRRALDAVAKEDLFYGIDGNGQPNSEKEVGASLVQLNRAHRDGLPVLVVEYLTDPAAVATASKAIASHGFTPYFAGRELNRLRTSD